MRITLITAIVSFALGFFLRHVFYREEVINLREQNKRYRVLLHNKVKLIAAVTRLRRNRLSRDLQDLKRDAVNEGRDRSGS